MKINTKVNGKDIQITLTKEQLSEIRKQTDNIKTIDDIQSYEDACKILHQEEADEDTFTYEQDWINHQILTIVKASNYIDNNYQVYKPNFNDNTYKYLPWFKKTSSGWVLHSLGSYVSYGFCPVGFYYKNQQSGETIVKRFITLYNKWLG